MAKVFKATLEVQCWKEHTCAACGTVYRYLFRRKGVGQGANEDAARQAASGLVARTLTRQVEMRPCPECGLYGADMIGARRWSRALWLNIPGFVVVLLVMVLGLEPAFPFATMEYLLAGLFTVLLLGNLAIALPNPNRNPEKNRSYARREIEMERMQRPDRVADDDEEYTLADVRGGVALWLAAGCMLTVLVFILLVAQISVFYGWPRNPGWRPDVAGPGDAAWVWFPQELRSIKGYWRGSAHGILLNARELGLDDNHIDVTTHEKSWDQKLSVKTSEKNNSATIWARVHVPDRPELTGKTLKIQMTVNAIFPVLDPGNNKSFHERSQVFTHTAELALATPRAGELYRSLWWVCALGGGSVYAFAVVFFLLQARALQRSAPPTKVIPLHDVDEE